MGHRRRPEASTQNRFWYGNYVDEHTNYRYHAFWSLKPYNSFWSTTTIYFMHISSSN